VNEGAAGDVLLALDIPPALFEDYEWVEDGTSKSYRESLIPASALNALGRPVLAKDCEICDQLIPLARLRAMPDTRRCLKHAGGDNAPQPSTRQLSPGELLI
jgi:hypothetical protein